MAIRELTKIIENYYHLMHRQLQKSSTQIQKSHKIDELTENHRYHRNS